MKIVKAEAEHLDAMVALEQECFTTPWSRNSFASEMENDDAHVTVAMDGEEVLGLALFHRMGYEGELYNIAVWPKYRGRGIGKALLQDVMENAKKNEVTRIYLEVRRSNDPAREMYRKAGFQICGIRKNYYEAPVEDAVLMEAEIC